MLVKNSLQNLPWVSMYFPHHHQLTFLDPAPMFKGYFYCHLPRFERIILSGMLYCFVLVKCVSKLLFLALAYCTICGVKADDPIDDYARITIFVTFIFPFMIFIKTNWFDIPFSQKLGDKLEEEKNRFWRDRSPNQYFLK